MWGRWGRRYQTKWTWPMNNNENPGIHIHDNIQVSTPLRFWCKPRVFWSIHWDCIVMNALDPIITWMIGIIKLSGINGFHTLAYFNKWKKRSYFMEKSGNMETSLLGHSNSFLKTSNRRWADSFLANTMIIENVLLSRTERVWVIFEMISQTACSFIGSLVLRSTINSLSTGRSKGRNYWEAYSFIRKKTGENPIDHTKLFFIR